MIELGERDNGAFRYLELIIEGKYDAYDRKHYDRGLLQLLQCLDQEAYEIGYKEGWALG
ncbi:MAG: hypothetical protein LBU35_03005 [Holosporales bacterium]|nr:hypothetical protein [Holosporales bacterium]